MLDQYCNLQRSLHECYREVLPIPKKDFGEDAAAKVGVRSVFAPDSMSRLNAGVATAPLVSTRWAAA